MLVGIVPSDGSKEPQSLTPYLNILIDEMLGRLMTIRMSHLNVRQQYCFMSWIILVSGVGKVMSIVGSGGFQGCMFCDIKGKS